MIKHADYYNAHKGSKFQNLHHVFQVYPHILQRYSAIFVIDDDIVIGTPSINRLFAIRDEFDYWVLQPAFRPWGKISHSITKARSECIRRHTNFVEMNCPLFRFDVLERFMQVYDPVLVGWGTDWWFLHVLGNDLRGRVAIIDSITCINPHDWTKGGREIDRLQSTADRQAIWRLVKEKYGIRSWEHEQIEYERFLKPPLQAKFGIVTDKIEGIIARIFNRIKLQIPTIG
jgi:hypothetical protein